MTQDRTHLSNDERIASMESLLGNLPLMAPSSTLDTRVAETLAAVPAASSNNADRPVNRIALLATAVACLLLGIALGRTSIPAQQSSDNLARDDSDAQQPEDLDQLPEQQDVHPGQLEPAITIARESPAQIYHDVFQVPPVALKCGLVGLSVPSEASSGDRCLNCHTGRADAHSKFRNQHMKHLTPDSCGLCHDTRRENSSKPEILGDPLEDDKSLPLSMLFSACVVVNH